MRRIDMHRGLVLGGLLLVPFSSFAIDYSRPAAPSNTTECVRYATTVVDAVEAFIANDASRDLSDSDIEEMMRRVNDIEDQGTYNEYRKMVMIDAYSWYRSTKYAYDPETMFLELRMECEMAVIDKDYEEDTKDLERLMGAE